jgi:hypothetical protein
MIRNLNYSLDRINDIEQASDDLAQLGTLLRWAGAAAAQVVFLPSGVILSELGSAVSWAGQEIERRCAVISEAASNIGPDGTWKTREQTEDAA